MLEPLSGKRFDQLMKKYFDCLHLEYVIKLKKIKTDEQLIGALNMSFDVQVLQKLTESVNGSKTSSETYGFIVLLHAILWINQKERNNDDLLQIFRSINKIDISNTQLLKIINIVFKSILNITINSDEQPNLDDNTIAAILLHFFINSELDSTFFNDMIMVFKYVSSKRKLNSEPVNVDSLTQQMYDLIKEIVVKERQIIQTDEISQLIVVLHPLLIELNPTALTILAKLSQTFQTQTIAESYVSIASTLSTRINTSPCKYQCKISKSILPQITLPALNNLKYEFTERKSLLFSNFRRLPFDELVPKVQIEELIPEDLFDSIKHIVAFLKDSSKIAQTTFLESIKHIIVGFGGSTSFYTVYASMLYICSQFIDEATLQEIIPVFVDSPIFDESVNVFQGAGYDPPVNTLRSLVFEMVESINPELITYLLFQLSKSYIVLTESLIRILLHEEKYDLEIFTTKLSLETIVKSALSMGYLPQTYEIQKARSANFCFLSYLLSKTGYTCLQSNVFVNVYLNFIFENDLAETILINLRNAFAAISKKCRLNICVIVLNKVIEACIQHRDDPRYVHIIEFMSSQLIEGLSLKRSPSTEFQELIISLLSFVQLYPNKNVLLNALRLFEITQTQMTGDFFKNFILAIKTVDGNEPSNEIKNALFNLMCMSTCHSIEEYFLIQNSQIIPLIICAYGESTQFEGIIRYFLTNLKNSDQNCRRCHDGDMDYLLLIPLCTHTSQIKYKGVTFILNIPNDELAFELIQTISMIKSNIAVSSLLVNHVQEPLICNFLMNTLYKCTSFPKNPLPIGQMKPQFKISGMYGCELNPGFIIRLKAKFDSTLLNRATAKVYLFQIIDADKNKLVFYAQKSNIYGCFFTNEYKITSLIAKIPTENKWVDYVFDFTMMEETVRIFTYQDAIFQNPSDIDGILFNESPVTIKIGGCDTKTNSPEVLGLIGEFELHPFTPREEIRDGKIISLKTVPFFMVDFDESCVLARPPVYRLRMFKKAKTFTFTKHPTVKCSSNLLVVLSNPMQMNEIVNNIETNGVTAILKEVFSKSLFCQQQFKSTYDIMRKMMENPNLLTYNFYLQMVGVMEVISHPQLLDNWFENLIINFWLWVQSDDDTIRLVFNHWCHTLIFSHVSMFKSKSYFSIMLRQFLIFYSSKEKEDLDENDECSELFSEFIVRIASLNITEDDIAEYFDYLVVYKDKTTKLRLLKMLAKFAPSIEAKSYIPTLCSLLCGDIDIAQQVIINAVLLGRNKAYEFLLGIVDYLKCDKQELFLRLTEDFETYPVLFLILCLLALRIDSSCLPLLPKTLSKKFIYKYKFWYVLLVVVAFYSNNEIQKEMCNILAMNLKECPYFIKGCGEILVFIQYVRLITPFWDSKLIFYYLLSLENVIDEDQVMPLADLCFSCCFFHLFGNQYHDLLRKEVARSYEKGIDMFEGEIPHDEVRQILVPSFDTIEGIKALMSCDVKIQAKFNMRLDPSNEWIDRDIALIAFNRIETTNSDIKHIFSHFLTDMPKEIGIIMDDAVNFRISEYQSLLDSLIPAIRYHLSKVISFTFEKPIINSDVIAISNYRLNAELSRKRSLIPTKEEPNDELKKDWAYTSFFCPMKMKRKSSKRLQYETVCPGESLFSINCKWMKFDTRQESEFVIFKDYILISGFLFSSHLIQFVFQRILTKNYETAIEIFLNNGKVIFLDFTPIESSLVIKQLQKANLPNVMIVQTVSSQEFFNSCLFTERWTAGLMSNFEFLMMVNITSGRTFNDAELYPIFPSICSDKDMNEVKDISKISSQMQLMMSGNYWDTNVLSPDFFFSPEVCGSIDAVYKHRQLLESPEISSKIHIWVNSYFGTKAPYKISHSRVLKKQPSQREPIRMNMPSYMKLKICDSEISYSAVINKEVCSCSILVITSNDEIKTLKISTSPEITCSFAQDIYHMKVYQDSLFSHDGKQVVIYSQYDRKLTTIKEGKITSAIDFCSGTEIMACASNTILFSPDSCAILRRYEPLGNVSIICYSEHRITHMTTSSTFKMFAFSTINDIVYVYSVRGKFVNKIEVSNCINHLCISPTWGFILVFTDGKLILLDVNGSFIKERKMKQRVLRVFQFTSVTGFDYVVFETPDHRLYSFETFYPEKMSFIEGLNDDIVEVVYDPTIASFIALERSGIIDIIPNSVVK